MPGKLPILLTFLFATCVLQSLSAEYFVIDNYDIDITVSEDNTYRIVETIDVDFSESRHGIFRNIPLKFNGRPVKLSGVSVRGFETKVDRSATEATIRIGSEDVLVNGKVRYRIAYNYNVGADDLPDMDEFNHNLIGPDWDTEIQSASFRIEMPAAFDASKLNFTSGDFGSGDNSGVEWSVDGTVISGKLSRSLRPRQGLTAALPLPEGYWVGARTMREPGWLLFRIFSYPFYAAVFLAAFILWYVKGRDNRLHPSVEFHPPEGMNPSEIGYIIDGSVENKDVTSLIVYWAWQGVLEIEEERVEKRFGRDETILHLTKIKELGKNAKGYEKRLFGKLFDKYGDGTKVSTEDLKNKFHTEVSIAKTGIKRSFTKDPNKAIYQPGTSRFTLVAGLLTALPVVTVLMEGFSVVTGSPVLSLIAVPFSLFLVLPSLMLGSAFIQRNSESKAKILFAVAFGGFSFLFFGIFISLIGTVPLLKYIAAVASTVGAAMFVSIMARRTEYGDRILEKTLGFKEFIQKAERDRLEVLFRSDPSYFYGILPYAMVLNLSDIWGSRFEDIAVQPPGWYRGYSYTRFNTAVFASAMKNSFQTMNTSMTSSPSSGGSSGSSSSGGFSGGGSGGGGGGSW